VASRSSPDGAADRPRGALIAVEGLDGSGKTALVDALARWLERRGRAVRIEAWEPSRTVVRAATDPRGRPALTPTVAALLAASDAVRRVDDRIRPRLAAGEIVLADRYAWTAVAREVARGLEPAWAAALYRPLPRPDLVLLLRGDAAAASERAMSARAPTVAIEAVGAAFGAFLERVLNAFERLEAGPESGPWPTVVVALDPTLGGEALARAARAAIREALPNVAA
jgi:thymidylate kinase